MKYSIPQGIEHRPIGVIGAGTLGRRIALMMSTQGGEVRIFDKMQKSREDGVKFVEETLPAVVTTVPNATAAKVLATGDLEAAIENAWMVRGKRNASDRLACRMI